MKLIICAIALVSGALLAIAASGTEPAPTARAPAGLVVTSPRICAAAAVYEIALQDDWGLRGTVAHASLNGFRDAGAVPDCAAAVAEILVSEFSPRRWQNALDAVDAVTSGSFAISPDACVRANAVVPLSSATRTHCVIYDLAFVEIRQ